MIRAGIFKGALTRARVSAAALARVGLRLFSGGSGISPVTRLAGVGWHATPRNADASRFASARSREHGGAEKWNA
ncbi:hypothetical protein GGQ68_004574 [Sagittula marina]|uniref:Uncharacterized protein n=1 Tax=Sagittula marina TaxID=943940 RepID=A0A7W6GV60_9RHOB|nr:hypothetical protein [Sagittula marina]